MADYDDERDANNQAAIERARIERVNAERERAAAGWDNAPNISTGQPAAVFSTDDSPPDCDPFIDQAGVYHPTSPKDSMDTELPQDQQSAYDPSLLNRLGALSEAVTEKAYGADVAAQQMEQAGLTLRDLPPIIDGETIIA